ncbi:MAG: alpha/beta hydrolase [Planctomycetaceae bacterium]|nr:alpha/beta hydrolase [Planctomycetaceae bacterium]
MTSHINLPHTYRHLAMPIPMPLRQHLSLIFSIMAVITAGQTNLYGDANHERLCECVTACQCSATEHQGPEIHSQPCCKDAEDRLWSISTRGITANACQANLEQPNLRFSRLSMNGCGTPSDLDQYTEQLGQSRQVVVYVHGNRMSSNDAIRRGLQVYRKTRGCSEREGIDWVIWSWPSDKEGILIHDARRKFRRLDAQGLYLSWLLRKHVSADTPTTLIGYSFGGRVITGALHALSGGKLGGRLTPGEPTTGTLFRCGLVAPALERLALTQRGVHAQATKNLEKMVLLYNRRDAVLKRFWLLNRVRGTMALGYSGPASFAPRFDGSKLKVVSRDCSSSVGINHVELDYYNSACSAGPEMAALINDGMQSE